MDLLIGDNDGAGSLCFLTHSYLRTQVLSRFKSDTLDERDLKTMIKQSLKVSFETFIIPRGKGKLE